MFPTRHHRAPATPIGRRPRRHRRILELEGLEERVVLSPATIYTVDLTTDTGPMSAGSGSGTTGDLRYVINQADANTNTAGSIIQFDPAVFATAQTITLSSSLGTLDLTETAGREVIDGPTAGVTVSGGNAVGVFSVSPGVNASLSDLTITGGSASMFGGGLYNWGTLTLTDCTVSGNAALSRGGGLYNRGTLTLTGCTVSGNSVGFGGGLFNMGTLTLTDCTVSGNSARFCGGGLDNRGTLTLTDCTVSGNSAGRGGGVCNYGTLTLTDCTVSGNSAAIGGGLSNEGTLTLTDCTVFGNSASRYCGGLDNLGTLTLTDCTVSGNSAVIGGGLYNSWGGTMTLTGCTVSGNSASSGGGLNNNLGTATLEDTILAGNTGTGGSASDITGTEASGVTGTYNLIGTGGSGGITDGPNGNIVLTGLTSLGLAPLGNYGGPTEDHGAAARQRRHRRRHGHQRDHHRPAGGARRNFRRRRHRRLPGPGLHPGRRLGEPAKHADRPGLRRSTGGPVDREFQPTRRSRG